MWGEPTHRLIVCLCPCVVPLFPAGWQAAARKPDILLSGQQRPWRTQLGPVSGAGSVDRLLAAVSGGGSCTLPDCHLQLKHEAHPRPGTESTTTFLFANPQCRAPTALEITDDTSCDIRCVDTMSACLMQPASLQHACKPSIARSWVVSHVCAVVCFAY